MKGKIGIKMSASEPTQIMALAISYLEDGLVISKAYKKRKFFFGPLRYFIEMEEGIKNYPAEIEKALKEERFEDVISLKAEFQKDKENLTNLFQEQVVNQKRFISEVFPLKS